MTAMTVRPRYLVDQSVMSHYRTNAAVERAIDELAVTGALCSSTVTMDEARFSARNAADLGYLTELYRSVFHWLPADDMVEATVRRIRTALWKIGAGRGAQTTDVQIAAVALRHDATVIHNDTDFVTIARAIPEFRHRRIAPN
ncbi:PIN domain-containing protein [Nocardia sp. NPDC058519]|uniref:PIN domain-containing protein n=1 Tax=Nocardia sp. NPDC058519 TaxID=3346535 RepID=UPI0036614511